MAEKKKRNVNKTFNDRINDIRQQQFNENFRISQPAGSNEILKKIDPVLELVKNHFNHPKVEQGKEYAELLKIITDLSTNVWRIRQKTIDPTTGEQVEEMRKILRPIEKIFTILEEYGIQVIDRTNQKYITGMYETVIAFEPGEQYTCELIVETVKPTVMLKGKLLQQGEIIVGVPPKQ